MGPIDANDWSIRIGLLAIIQSCINKDIIEHDHIEKKPSSFSFSFSCLVSNGISSELCQLGYSIVVCWKSIFNSSLNPVQVYSVSYLTNNGVMI